MNKKKNGRPNQNWLLQMADIEDTCISVAVGGMAEELGMLQGDTSESPRVFGRLIEFARRSRRLSVERLADIADIELSEIVAIERGEDVTPQPRTVYQLGHVFELPSGMLLEVAGLAKPRDVVNKAALKFAAHCEPTSQLSEAEWIAFEEFIKVLVESSDGG